MHECHGRADKAGITAIVGLGASPGITSLLTRGPGKNWIKPRNWLQAWNIEEVPEVMIELAYSAAIVHWMQQCSGTILECENGSLVEQKPLSEVSLEYPGRGKEPSIPSGIPSPSLFIIRFRYASVPSALWSCPDHGLADSEGWPEQIERQPDLGRSCPNPRGELRSLVKTPDPTRPG